MGAIVLRTVVYLSQIVAGLAMTLERNPQLLAQLRLDRPQDAFERTSLVEDAANVVREGFIKCLSDRGGAAGPKGKVPTQSSKVSLHNHLLSNIIPQRTESLIFTTLVVTYLQTTAFTSLGTRCRKLTTSVTFNV